MRCWGERSSPGHTVGVCAGRTLRDRTRSLGLLGSFFGSPQTLQKPSTRNGRATSAAQVAFPWQGSSNRFRDFEAFVHTGVMFLRSHLGESSLVVCVIKKCSLGVVGGLPLVSATTSAALSAPGVPMFPLSACELRLPVAVRVLISRLFTANHSSALPSVESLSILTRFH